jgi:hypothetical protein
MGEFKIGDRVEKHTGDYRLRATFGGIFTMCGGAVRYVIDTRRRGRRLLLSHLLRSKPARRTACFGSGQSAFRLR